MVAPTSPKGPLKVARHPSAGQLEAAGKPDAGSHLHGKAKQARNVWRAWRLAKSPRKAAVANSQHGPHMRSAAKRESRPRHLLLLAVLFNREALNSTVVLRQFSRQRDWECFLHIPQTIALNICRAEEASPGMPAESGRH